MMAMTMHTTTMIRTLLVGWGISMGWTVVGVVPEGAEAEAEPCGEENPTFRERQARTGEGAGISPWRSRRAWEGAPRGSSGPGVEKGAGLRRLIELPGSKSDLMAIGWGI